jgi:membrane protein insertase Oxa1/YidC/SpoIIIJ
MTATESDAMENYLNFGMFNGKKENFVKLRPICAFPVNILPLIMGVTMFWQMHMEPMPTSDDSQNLLTIVQQFATLYRSKVHDEIFQHQ